MIALFYFSEYLAIVPKITNEYPDQPQASGKTSQDQVNDQSDGTAFLLVFHSNCSFLFIGLKQPQKLPKNVSAHFPGFESQFFTKILFFLAYA